MVKTLQLLLAYATYVLVIPAAIVALAGAALGSLLGIPACRKAIDEIIGRDELERVRATKLARRQAHGCAVIT